jgi:hypothetical protein
MLDKFKEIAQSWITASNPTEEEKVKAEIRIDICNECDERQYLKAFDIFICSVCKCPLNKKIYSPTKKSCPLGKWTV